MKIKFEAGKITKEILTRSDLKRVVNEEALGSKKKKKKCFYTCAFEIGPDEYATAYSWGITCTTTSQCVPGEAAVLAACLKTYDVTEALVGASCDPYPG